MKCHPLNQINRINHSTRNATNTAPPPIVRTPIEGPHRAQLSFKSTAHNRWLRIIIALFALWLCSITSVQAAPLNVGSTVPNITLKDQFGTNLSLQPSTQVLVFSHQKAVNALVSEHFKTLGAEQIKAKHWLYFADISGMPSLITRLFALPKMRQLNFSIGLSDQAAQLAMIPRIDQHATIIHLHNMTVRSIHHAKSSAQLKQMLNSAQ